MNEGAPLCARLTLCLKMMLMVLLMRMLVMLAMLVSCGDANDAGADAGACSLLFMSR